MSDLEKELSQKLQAQSEYISVQDLPQKIKAKLVKYEFKADKRGNQCLFLTLETTDQKFVVQKYTLTTWQPLFTQMKLVGFENLQKQFCTWRKQNLGQTIQPRLYPTLKE